MVVLGGGHSLTGEVPLHTLVPDQSPARARQLSGASERQHLQEGRSYMKRESTLKLSGNKVYYTACS